MRCVTCTETFDTERAMRIHHKLKHGKSISKENTVCIECGDEFTYYPSDKPGLYCSKCVEDPHVTWSSPPKFGEENPRHGIPPEEHPMWAGGYDPGYIGPEWNRAREKCLDRDNKTCQLCGATKEEMGQNPDVHHIIPVRKFDEYEEAHKLDNLICLCRSCHGKVEHGTETLK